MKKKYKIALSFLLGIAATLLIVIYLYPDNIAVLDPKGMVAAKQRDLIITASLLMLIVVIPVMFLTVIIAWKYRETNKKAQYSPDWDNSHIAEIIWWGIPCVIIFILSIMTWNSSHELDPYKSLDNKNKPLTIQVVALQWKWLFIYPEQNIATLNYVQFPTHTPLNFNITADAPMNSFWIPKLGGQIYAMPGMRTQLHLIASEPGNFDGSSANLSGVGFAGMKFVAKACSQEEFNTWVRSVKDSPNALTKEEYLKIVQPSTDNPQTSYVLKNDNLYEEIIMKYTTPPQEMQKDKTHD